VEDGDCVRCGKRKYLFWDDPVGEMLLYLPSHALGPIMFAIAHNGKAFDLHFFLNRAIVLKRKAEMIMNGLKIMCMKMEYLVFLDSVSYLPCALRKLPEAFNLSASKSWHPHYFNTVEKVIYVGPIPDNSYYGTNVMREEERRELLFWYESQRSETFNNRRVLEIYCQDDVTVLRQACRLFRREFLHIGHFDVSVESITITSACNKVLRKRFLQSDTRVLIPTGGSTSINKYKKKDMMWLMNMEQTDGVKRKHGRNGRD